MVKHPNIHQSQCLFQRLRQNFVGTTWFGDTGRVIVRKNNGRGIVP